MQQVPSERRPAAAWTGDGKDSMGFGRHSGSRHALPRFLYNHEQGKGERPANSIYNEKNKNDACGCSRSLRTQRLRYSRHGRHCLSWHDRTRSGNLECHRHQSGHSKMCVRARYCSSWRRRYQHGCQRRQHHTDKPRRCQDIKRFRLVYREEILRLRRINHHEGVFVRAPFSLFPL